MPKKEKTPIHKQRKEKKKKKNLRGRLTFLVEISVIPRQNLGTGIPGRSVATQKGHSTNTHYLKMCRSMNGREREEGKDFESCRIIEKGVLGEGPSPNEQCKSRGGKKTGGGFGMSKIGIKGKGVSPKKKACRHFSKKNL